MMKNLWALAIRSITYYRRINLAVAFAVAAATAVLTGALVVGDSVRFSLRSLVLDRLGDVDEALVVDQFFRTELVERLRESDVFDAHYESATGVIMISGGTVDRTAGGLQLEFRAPNGEPGAPDAPDADAPDADDAPAEETWRVRAVHVAAGDTVRPGDLLCEVARDERTGNRPVVADREATVTEVFVKPNDTLRDGDSVVALDRELRVAPSANVLVVGCGEAFWKLGSVRPRRLPEYDEVVLNQTLADDLRVRAGDRVTVRLPKASGIPADSTLAKKTDRVRNLAQLTVIEVLPAESLGRFSLRANQNLPRNAYLSLEMLQEALDQEGRANAILAAGRGSTPPSAEASRALTAALRPELGDLGLHLDRSEKRFGQGESAEVVFGYYSLTSDRMMLPDGVLRAAEAAWDGRGGQPVLTYLANTLARASGGAPESPDTDNTVSPDTAAPKTESPKTESPKTESPETESPETAASETGRSLPYSTVSGLDPTAAFPLQALTGEPIAGIGEDGIVLNQFAAEQMKAAVGDTIRIDYFQPETTHGETTETSATFRVEAIGPLAEPDEPYGQNGEPPLYLKRRPTRFNDPDLTPVVEGITDQKSIDDWDPPFPFDRTRNQAADDLYWDNHRTTPKALVSLKSAQRLWGSRFGTATSYRVPLEAGSAEDLGEALLAELRGQGETLGLEFSSVKRRDLQAAAGTTPFDVLFVLLSFFIIISTLLLVALLFRLGVDQRAREVGTLLATGWKRGQIARLLVIEGLGVSLLGGLLGCLIGVGYAWLMIAGLKTWWVGAVSTPFLKLSVHPLTLSIGYLAGVLVCVLTIAASVRRLRKLAPRQLLAGQVEDPLELVGGHRRWLDGLAVLLLLAAVGLAAAALGMSGEAQAGAFVGGGALILTALLTLIWNWLRGGRRAASRRWNLWGLAGRNAGRNPARSTLTIGLMAVASFLIVSMSAFRLAPTDSGTGGFDLLAESSQPLFADLTDPRQRADALGNAADALEGGTILSLRVKPGDDASCRNLYRSQHPRILGVTPQLVAHFDAPGGPAFAWAGSAAASEAQRQNPWHLLDSPPPVETPATADSPRPPAAAIPVVLDKNTAMYSLQLYGGVGERFTFEYDGRPVEFEVVGLLSNSILQGSLLISEANFRREFPEISGYNYFLVDAPPEAKLDDLAYSLWESLSDQGFETQQTRDVLADLLAVQNTYLSTFQSLGLLGLLLGTLGLATVQIRSILERRGELALMRATGFRRRRLSWMVLLENSSLLIGGLATGVLAALLAVLPHWWLQGAAIPWQGLAVMLAAVLVVGTLTGLAAVVVAVRAPLLSALRGD